MRWVHCGIQWGVQNGHYRGACHAGAHLRLGQYRGADRHPVGHLDVPQALFKQNIVFISFRKSSNWLMGWRKRIHVANSKFIGNTTLFSVVIFNCILSLEVDSKYFCHNHDPNTLNTSKEASGGFKHSEATYSCEASIQGMGDIGSSYCRLISNKGVSQ